MKIGEIISSLIAWHQPYENPRTRDTVKCGDVEQECTGIAITCYATPSVIRKAVEKHCNLLIVHESLFYGDSYDTKAFWDLPAYRKKTDLLKNSQIVVFRDHDHMHGKGRPWVPERIRNDYIYYGFMKEMGWENYVIGDQLKPLWYRIPEISLKELADFLMDKLNLNGIRIVGEQDMTVSTVFMAEHCSGDKGDDAIIREAAEADVIIPLEICDWTVSAYVRDAVEAGEKKAILEMGHFNVEEPGMKYMAQWLPEAIGTDSIPIHFIQSGDGFQYRLRERSLDLE